MTARRIPSLLPFAYSAIAFAFMILSPAVSHGAPQDSGYRVLRTIHLGGDGGWDYVTVDSAARRVYIPRGTHIMVIDADSGKLVSDIQGMNGLHGVAVAPEFNRGFVTGNKTEQEGTIYIFDLKTSMLISSIKSNSIDTDSLIYDASTKRVYVNNGDGMNLTVVDAATEKVVGKMAFNANPEAPAADGKGSIFQDYESPNTTRKHSPLRINGRLPAAMRRLPFRWTKRIGVST